MKFYRGSATAARNYVEADRSRADDYYLAEGTGIAEHFVATVGEGTASVQAAGGLDGDAYEAWVAGLDPETQEPKGRLREDDNALRFVEVVVNGPKTWSIAAAMHPELGEAYDAAQSRAAHEIISWLAEHATTRVGPRGRQVQVPVERLDAAVVRHYTSRAGDPHRHLHLQINARVFAAGAWRGLHSVGVVDSVDAINGMGHAAVLCDPEFRNALAAHGYTVDADTGEIAELQPYAGAFSARAAQIRRHVDTYEAAWRREHPGQEPGPTLRRSWDRRAWAHARPDKVVPKDGAELVQRWRDELYDLGFTAPQHQSPLATPRIADIDRDAAAAIAVQRIGARRSSWNTPDLRGEAERLVAATGLVSHPAARRDLAEDITARATALCVPLLERPDVPEHVRSLTSPAVLEVEQEINTRLLVRGTTNYGAGVPSLDDTPAHEFAHKSAHTAHQTPHKSAHKSQTAHETAHETAHKNGQPTLDPTQRHVVGVLTSKAPLTVVEGAAGAGKTTVLSQVHATLAEQGTDMVVVAPTQKAAQVAAAQIGTRAHSAGWLAHQHGFRWDDNGRWERVPALPLAVAQLKPGSLLVIDEAGMLDQDTGRALLTIADEAGARVAFIGDRHQLPAVGRGGVLDAALRASSANTSVTLDAVHRFRDRAYADLSLQMRTGERPAEVFDALHRRGEVVIHASEVERTAHLAELAQGSSLVIADSGEQVRALNAAIRPDTNTDFSKTLFTSAGETITVGDRISTRRNNADLDIANRETWTVIDLTRDGLVVEGERGRRALPYNYCRAFVELSYATTVHGAQGQTVDEAHFVLGDGTGAASAYVGMTRGRESNTVHVVASDVESARDQWVRTFSRERADLGPAHAGRLAAADVERYGVAKRPPIRPSAAPKPPPTGVPAPGPSWRGPGR